MTTKIRNFFSPLRIAGGFACGLCLLFIVTLSVVSTGCTKERLFINSDTLPSPPGQFHFFNSFVYDTALAFNVDGLLRESVAPFHFSAYYPSHSAFNHDPTQPDSKLVQVYDPQAQTQYFGTQTFQFKPNTSYIVVPTYGSYDTAHSPKITTKPSLAYIPEDIQHPFDGTTRVRFINLTGAQGGTPSATLTITPDKGAGTTLQMGSFPAGYSPNIAATTTYTTTAPGLKTVSVLIVNGGVTTRFIYLPANFNNSQNYTLLMVGDYGNFVRGLEPRPRMFLSPDGDPAHLQELVLSSLSYPGNNSTTSQVTVIDGAFNIPGLLNFGTGNNIIQYPGLNVNFNQTAVQVNRWPLTNPSGAWIEDVGDLFDPNLGTKPLILKWKTATVVLPPNQYQVTLTPTGAFTPVYNHFSYNFQQGLAYTVCMLPNLTTSQQCSQLVMQNDNQPVANLFRLRVINLLGGSTQVDIHIDSLNGPLLAGGVPYAQETSYVNMASDTRQHNLYVTASGSGTPLFQTGNPLQPVPLSFNGGNSGTLYLMGLLPGTPYSGEPNPYPPYAMYNADASVNPNAALSSQQLYF